MGALSTVIVPDGLRSFNTASFTGNYQAIGVSLPYPMRVVKFTNLSNVTATISWDGINDHEILPSNSFVLIDISGNRENSGLFEVQQGTQFYVKGSAGIGLVYISCYYGK